MKPALPRRARQAGMLLPALILLLAMGGLGWLLAGQDSAADRAARELAADRRTERALQTAREALLGFAATYRNKEHPNADFGYLPCPDLDGDGSSETCGHQNQPSVGRLPYLTLNLPDLRDGSGECLWYAVSGAFKNNPKAESVNWDSAGSFRLLDADARVMALPGDPSGLAAALVIAPGRPLPGQQRSPGPGRCGGDQEAGLVAAYLEALGTTSGTAPVDVPTLAGGGNDRLVAITNADIYTQLKSRAGYATHLQTVLQALAECLVASGLPGPLNGSVLGPVHLGRLPATDKLHGTCRNPDLRDPATNWAPMARYARCSDGSECLSGVGGRCRGVLVFAGERLPGQSRLGPPDQQSIDAYLEEATLAALRSGQLAALPTRIQLSFATRNQAAGSDVAFCLP